MLPVLRRSCTWIKCWHSREAQGGMSCRKTALLYFCSVQCRRLCSGGKLNVRDRQHCVLSQCKYNSCQFSSLQSSQDGFSHQRTPLTAAWQHYCNRSLHPEWHTLSTPSIQVRRLTWNNLPQALVRHRLAQTCWLHLTHFYWKVSWELCTYTPGSWSGQTQNHAGALQFLVCDYEEVKKEKQSI